MQHIFACDCGAETECKPENIQIGAAFKCPSCKTYWGRVAGDLTSGWFRLDSKEVEFRGIFRSSDEDEENQ